MAGSANPAMTQAAANPYTMASEAQKAAMGNTANMMTATAAGGMANYQNPYETQVVNAALRDIGSQAQAGFNNLEAQAHQAKAFGGSRHGIAQAEMAKGYTQQMADTAARMRQQGFNTALGASQADLQRQMGAASQLAGMGQQSFNYGQSISNQQMQQGAMQQALQQQLINAAKQQFAGYAGQPNTAMNTFMSGISGMPNMGGQTSSFSPGLFNYMQLGASLMQPSS